MASSLPLFLLLNSIMLERNKLPNFTYLLIEGLIWRQSDQLKMVFGTPSIYFALIFREELVLMKQSIFLILVILTIYQLTNKTSYYPRLYCSLTCEFH